MSKLNDALGLIQRAEGSIAANADESYGEMLGNLVENFKRKLSQDFGLPVEFFEPIDPDLQDAVSNESDETSEDPELTPEAERLYQEIETSIGCFYQMSRYPYYGRDFFIPWNLYTHTITSCRRYCLRPASIPMLLGCLVWIPVVIFGCRNEAETKEGIPSLFFSSLAG